MQNFISNAIKYTPRGRVLVGCRRHGQSLQIGVYDTGVGIPEDDQVKVFEDFRQLDASPARGYGGTGLGLSICRQIMETYGGSISASNRRAPPDGPGGGRLLGARFTIRVPAADSRQ